VRRLEKSLGAISLRISFEISRSAGVCSVFTGLVIIRSSVNGVPFKYQIPSRPWNHLNAKSDGDTSAIRGEFRVRCATRPEAALANAAICIANGKTIVVPLSIRRSRGFPT